MTASDFLTQYPGYTLMLENHPQVSGVYVARAVTCHDTNCTGHYTLIGFGSGDTPEEATDDLVRALKLSGSGRDAREESDAAGLEPSDHI